MKKIIEEQQRISGTHTDTPGSGVSAPGADNNFPESDYKTDPTTPVPTSEPPFTDNLAKVNVTAKSLSVDESFSHEPLTPDSSCNMTAKVESPSERPGKKQRTIPDLSFPEPESLLNHSVLESSLSSPYQQPHSLF